METSRTKGTFGERVEEAMERAGLTQAALARKVGVNPKTIERYIARQEPPSTKRRDVRKTIEGLSKVLNVRTDWLLKGEGEMLLSGQNNGEEPPATQAPLSHQVHHLSDEELAEHDLYRVRRIAVNAGTGSDLVFLDERGEEEVLTGDYIRKKYQVEPRRLAEVRVHGESMNAPPANIKPGSVLRVALMNGYQEVLSGAVYVIYGPMGYQLKRLKIVQEPENGHEIERFIWLWSDNEVEGRDKLPIEVWERDYQVVAMVLSVENSL